MRRAFVETLCLMAEKDPRIVFLTGDLGFQVFDEFIARFGSRYINVGIAEAQMVCAAAGLAKEGYRPLVYSIASFMTGRPFEQLRISVAYPGLPVIVVGAGGGYCYANSGVTHHATEDLALMSLLPGMTVTAPGDPGEVRTLLPQLTSLSGPSYIRIGKFGEPSYAAEEPVVLGRARWLRKGAEKVTVITTGEMAVIALDAADRLKKECGWSPDVVQFHTVKPLDEKALADIAQHTQALIVAEESCPQGGVAAAIMSWMMRSGVSLKFQRLGPPDLLALGNPKRETLRHKFHYGSEAIFNACRGLPEQQRVFRG